MTTMTIILTLAETLKTMFVSSSSAVAPIFATVAVVITGWVIVNFIPTEILTKKEVAENE